MFIAFALGLILGALFSVTNILIALSYKSTVNRTIHTLSAKMKTKGKIVEPKSEELEDWVETLTKE